MSIDSPILGNKSLENKSMDNKSVDNMGPEQESSSALQLAEKASAHMHSSDYCAQMMGIDILDVAPGFAKLSMTVRSEFANGHGMCQGGLVATAKH